MTLSGASTRQCTPFEWELLRHQLRTMLAKHCHRSEHHPIPIYAMPELMIRKSLRREVDNMMFISLSLVTRSLTEL